MRNKLGRQLIRCGLRLCTRGDAEQKEHSIMVSYWASAHAQERGITLVPKLKS